ncbi:hypothetical protein IWX92DRAFT_403110 [Phyllosticta citricarpa]
MIPRRSSLVGSSSLSAFTFLLACLLFHYTSTSSATMSEHAPPEEFAMALQIIRDLRGQYHALGTEYQGQVATVLELEQQLQQQQWEGQRELDITGLQARLQNLVNQNWQALSQNIIARADEMLQRIEAMAEDVFNAENVAALLRPPTRESSLHSESTGAAEDQEDQIKVIFLHCEKKYRSKTDDYESRLAAVEEAVFGNDDSIPSSPVLTQHQQQQRQGQSQSLDQISRAKERLQERMSGSGDDDDNWKRRVTVLEEDLRALIEKLGESSMYQGRVEEKITRERKITIQQQHGEVVDLRRRKGHAPNGERRQDARVVVGAVRGVPGSSEAHVLLIVRHGVPGGEHVDRMPADVFMAGVAVDRGAEDVGVVVGSARLARVAVPPRVQEPAFGPFGPFKEVSYLVAGYLIEFGASVCLRISLCEREGSCGKGSLPLVPSRVDKKLLLVLRRPIWRLRAIVDVAAKGAAPGLQTITAVSRQERIKGLEREVPNPPVASPHNKTPSETTPKPTAGAADVECAGSGSDGNIDGRLVRMEVFPLHISPVSRFYGAVAVLNSYSTSCHLVLDRDVRFATVRLQSSMSFDGAAMETQRPRRAIRQKMIKRMHPDSNRPAVSVACTLTGSWMLARIGL